MRAFVGIVVAVAVCAATSAQAQSEIRLSTGAWKRN